MITRAAAAPPRLRIALAIAGLGAAVALRCSIGGVTVAASQPAAAAFAAALLAVALTQGGRLSATDLRRGAVIGVAGALLLVAAPWLRGAVTPPLAPGIWLESWLPLVAAVAAAEELVLRGLLWEAITARCGEIAAWLITALLFALIHLPLYGWNALPLDLAVGLVLGALRAWSGGVGAPLIAHVLADWASAAL